MYYQIVGTQVRIAGSMHLVPAGATLPQWVSDAYCWSEDIYLEANQKEAQKYFLLQAGDSSESRVSVDVWAALKSIWPETHPLGALGPQKLWVIAIGLSLSGIPLALGVENFVTAQAEADGRGIQYLESGAEFSQLMDDVTETDYARGFEWLLHSTAETRARNIAEMYRAWASGQLQAVVEAQQHSPLAQFPGIREIVFERRNRLWLPRIVATLASNKRTLIVVGAGHLGGERGVLRMLEDEGYRWANVA
jgi:uncharacterized protein YbaP (TraB family)